MSATIEQLTEDLAWQLGCLTRDVDRLAEQQVRNARRLGMVKRLVDARIPSRAEMTAKQSITGKLIPYRSLAVDQLGRPLNPQAKVKALEPGIMAADFVMSNDCIDRVGDVMIAKGCDMREFLKNPVALLQHKSEEWPIGKWTDVRVEGRNLVGRLVFSKINPNGEMAYRLLEEQVIGGCSIGFIPLQVESRKSEGDDDPGGQRIVRWKLLECSVVSIPANPEAMVQAIAKGCTPSGRYLDPAMRRMLTPMGAA